MSLFFESIKSERRRGRSLSSVRIVSSRWKSFCCVFVVQRRKKARSTIFDSKRKRQLDSTQKRNKPRKTCFHSATQRASFFIDRRTSRFDRAEIRRRKTFGTSIRWKFFGQLSSTRFLSLIEYQNCDFLFFFLFFIAERSFSSRRPFPPRFSLKLVKLRPLRDEVFSSRPENVSRRNWELKSVSFFVWRWTTRVRSKIILSNWKKSTIFGAT